MKNILLILAIAISSASFAQGNLQFNQVKLVTTVETVPAGKVWKVESVTFTDIPNVSTIGNVWNITSSILINGASRQVRTIRGRDKGSTATTDYWEQSFPLWLPAGTSLAINGGVYEISVIEFNVVP